MDIITNQKKRLKVIINVVVLLFSIISLSKKDGAVHKVSFFDSIILDSIGFVQKITSRVSKNVSSSINNYLVSVEAQKENKKLRKHIEELESKLFTYKEVKKDNIRLRKFFKFTNIPYTKVMTQVVSRDILGSQRILRVNKGSSDGVHLQSVAITAKGLVGYVYRMTKHFSDILTILDGNNKVDAIINRTRTYGIIEGYSSEKCIMKYVNRMDSILLNDTVMTSGLGNIYPKGIIIGKVTKINRESYGITQDIKVTPSVDFTKIEEVVLLIIKDNNMINRKIEWEALSKKSI